MKAELGRSLREQISCRQERERNDSLQRKAEGFNAQTEWAQFNQRRDLEEKVRKAQN